MNVKQLNNLPEAPKTLNDVEQPKLKTQFCKDLAKELGMDCVAVDVSEDCGDLQGMVGWQAYKTTIEVPA